MTTATDDRFRRLFAALAAGDLETADQQLDTLRQQAPSDPRLGDAVAQRAAIRGDYRSTAAYLAWAAGAVSSPPGREAFTPRPAPAPPTVFADQPDRYALRSISPGSHERTVVCGTAVENTDWSGLNLTPLAFEQVAFRHLRIGDAELGRTVWDDCEWNPADFSRGRGEEMLWSGGRWAGVVANGAHLAGSRWHAHQFYFSQLMNAEFTGAVFSSVRFDSCEILGADFTDATLIRVRFGHAHMPLLPTGQVSFRNALLIDCDLSGADLDGADFTGAVVVHSAFDPMYTAALASARVLSRPLNRGLT